jgi:predicted helicase
VLAVVRHVYGLRGVRFRRYGIRGQKQHGIDLAGHDPDGTYIVVQCKDYQSFTASVLRTAVTAFMSGRLPFDATHLIVATSASTEPTQFVDELATLQWRRTRIRECGESSLRLQLASTPGIQWQCRISLTR